MATMNKTPRTWADLADRTEKGEHWMVEFRASDTLAYQYSGFRFRRTESGRRNRRVVAAACEMVSGTDRTPCHDGVFCGDEMPGEGSTIVNMR